MKDLPLYKVEINEEDEITGVDFISLVDKPAMEVNWLKFNKEEPIQMLFKSDIEKKILFGVFIMADTPIERYDEKLGSYYCVFEKDTITKIIKKFNKNNYNRNINFQHGNNIVSAFVVENFQTSPLIKTDFGFEVKEGSWVGSIYIEDDAFWNNYIKTDKLTGFSIELISKLSKYEDKQFEDFDTYNKIESILKENDDYETIYSEISKLLKDDYNNFIIEPKEDETEDEFIDRCMNIETNNYDTEQAYAICKSKWDNRLKNDK